MASLPLFHGQTLLKKDSVYKYILETTVYPRENEHLRELRLITGQHQLRRMGSAPDELQFFQLLLKILNAKNTIEVGVFTGYSLLATALALPHDGKIIAIDINRENYEIGRPIIEKAVMAHKIDFREGPALNILDKLVYEEENKGKYDFAYVDADKVNFLNYHERLLELVHVGGVIAYDNTLWGGSVVGPAPDWDPEGAELTRNFNERISADPRVEISQLSIADGITLCRRIT
ncbi:hypothetical protein LUZ60_003302 [Juncus effusus]|nr:hypothetical protein LUZ60_003302 [Juncus effusus]